MSDVSDEGTHASDDAATTVVAVRHGETDWNCAGRIQGHAPTPLNERGREQARTLGEHLAATYAFDRVVASDLRRTRETVALLREAGVAPAPTFEAAWRERDFGVHQGLTSDELYDRHPEFAKTSGVLALETRPEGGESIRDVHERVLGAVEDLRGGGATLVVTHGGPLSVLRGAARGVDLLTAMREWSPDNCSVLEFRLGERLELVREAAPVD